MDTDIAALTDDQLTDEITTWAGRIAAAEAHLIDLVAELDRRGSWFGPGLLSTAHWLSWRLGMGLKAAHERVRVARALPTLPLTNDAFHAGRLSWTQVRAVTRVASADDEATYLECARHASGAQLEKLVRGVRRARKPSEDAADPERAAWLMRTRLSYDDDGTLVVTIRLPAERGAVVIAALEEAMADLDRERESVRRAESSAEDAAGPVADAAPGAAPGTGQAAAAPDNGSVPRATHAEGLVQLCEGYLARVAEKQPGRARRGRARLRVHIDPLSGWSRLHDGELLPPGTLGASLACLGGPGRLPSGLRALTTDDLTSHDLGRSRHDPSPALRQLIATIDGERCRFSGCPRRRRLHAHHVTPWAQGGSTDLANLVLLCPRHHTLVHAGGFSLVLLPDRRLSIATAAGIAVPHRPPLPFEPAQDLLEALCPQERSTQERSPQERSTHAPIDAGTLPPQTSGDRLDLHYAVAVLVQQAA